jgi:hypothetical protein
MPNLPITKVANKSSYMSIHEDAIVVIGGSEGKFVPNINAKKWDDECWLNINHRETIVGNESAVSVDAAVSLKVGGVVHKYYVDENGDLEYEIILESEPKLNTIELDLDYPDGMTFHYQPKLTEEELKEGCIRPERVVGSYAAYFNKAHGKYSGGKFAHIYRPELIDAKGKRKWANIEIDEKVKKARIICDFSDMVFPVIIDPTLGFSGTPGSSFAASSTAYRTTGVASGYTLVAPSSGNSVTMYVYKSDATDLVGYVAIYASDLSLLVSQSFTVTGSAGWKAVTITSTDIVGGNTYYPMIGMTTNAGGFGYDSTSGNGCMRMTSFTTPPNPWTDTNTRTYAPGVYIEYVASEAAFTFTGSGTLTFSGNASVVPSYTATGVGNVTFTGNATSSVTLSQNGSGTLSLSGSASTSLSLSANGAGTLTLSGAATTSYTGNTSYSCVGSGTLTFNGVATTSYTGPSSFAYVGSGSLSFTGVASSSLSIRSTGSGVMGFSGSADTSLSLSYNGSGQLDLSGDALVTPGYVSVGSGTLTLSGAADTSYSLSTYAYVGSGTLLLTGAAITSYTGSLGVGLWHMTFSMKNPSANFSMKKPSMGFTSKRASLTIGE